MGLFWRSKQKCKLQRGTVDYNAKKMERKYPTTKNGYFGVKGNNKRVIYSENQYKESKSFYLKIGKGGVEVPLPNKHGVQKTMKDGGRVVYREKTSTKDSPAIDLGQMKGKIQNQRIHFEKRRIYHGK